LDKILDILGVIGSGTSVRTNRNEEGDPKVEDIEKTRVDVVDIRGTIIEEGDRVNRKQIVIERLVVAFTKKVTGRGKTDSRRGDEELKDNRAMVRESGLDLQVLHNKRIRCENEIENRGEIVMSGNIDKLNKISINAEMMEG
jgi:hypothetical protein